MFGSSRPVVLNRYGRSRRSVPRWLVLLVTGIAIGAAGVIIVQERYLPPRLSAAASSELRESYAQADADRQRLKRELSDTSGQLAAANKDKAKLAADLATSRDGNERLRQVASSLVSSLPPDPRGGAVEVRAARFTVDNGALAYDLVLTRAGAATKAQNGVLQLAVTGVNAHGTETTSNLQPVNVSIGPYESLRGSVPLPEGFKPRQATLNVLDAPGGRLLGKRVMYVK